MSVIPESGRPIDLNLKDIATVADADAVIWWLTDVIGDMNRQISEAPDPEAAWLKKVKSARWWAGHLRHKAREIRSELGGITPREAVAAVIMEFLADEEDVEELEDLIVERYPHLSGIVLSDIFS